ncbi:hypothetical protein GCM10023115_35600 [Pontixanthobacter gangjinensis]|uniref:DUF255 domain-containing protein n=1 Tax=Christiangramia aestuarii TaxID=1028746 RepID=A0A7K1LR34_9FLAO|nr:thioredoxin family protein [Christiangramia aestuarii]MUP43272.1 DUF255 domain-containing protein [Christiangramia aestuarii]
MKKFLFLTIILCWQTQSAQKAEVNWIGFEQLEDSLKVETKPVVIYFYTDWCAYCKKMDRNAFRNQEVVSALNGGYYAVKMNAESTENIEFDGQVFRNEQAEKKRNGIHQIPLLLAGRKNESLAFPVVMVLDKDFRIKRKSHQYLTSEMMKKLLKGS